MVKRYLHLLSSPCDTLHPVVRLYLAVKIYLRNKDSILNLRYGVPSQMLAHQLADLLKKLADTYYIPDSMTYKDWKQSMVGGDTSDLVEAETVESIQKKLMI